MKNVPTEADEQSAFVEWLELKGLKFSSIPNSTYTTSWNQKHINKKLGLRKGLPDLLIVVPNDCLIFIEMKRKKKSKTYPEQKDWIEALNSVDNVAAVICYGADEAIAAVEKNLPNNL